MPGRRYTRGMSSKLNVGVVGCGRMGKLHTRVFSQMPQVGLVGVHDADPDFAAAAADAYGTKAFDKLEELLSQVSAVVVAVPTRFHLEVARRCIAANVHMLIEKPLAGTAAECEEIATASKAAGLTVQVGHVERFNPAVRAMSRLSTADGNGIVPKFIEVTRVSPLTFRSIDVGVVLDMMIHDIDIVLLLAGGSPVASVEATGVSVIGGAEDVCNARVRFESGCVANLTASRLALKTERKLRVFSPDAYVSLDYQKKYAMVARRGQNLSAIRDTVARIRAGEIEDLSQLNYSDLVQVEELQIDDVEPLRAELDAFVAAVTGKTRPVVSAEDGLAAVKLAERIVEAIGGTSL
jgi:predicted dehydrogenase